MVILLWRKMVHSNLAGMIFVCSMLLLGNLCIPPLTGMHLNKVLYSSSYTSLTTGAAGILFTGLYVLVRYLTHLHFGSLKICLFCILPCLNETCSKPPKPKAINLTLNQTRSYHKLWLPRPIFQTLTNYRVGLTRP